MVTFTGAKRGREKGEELEDLVSVKPQDKKLSCRRDNTCVKQILFRVGWSTGTRERIKKEVKI